MSKKTDDFITGLQIAGGVILAGAAVRHASHLIDGRLEEARYNYGNYPGPPHDLPGKPESGLRQMPRRARRWKPFGSPPCRGRRFFW